MSALVMRPRNASAMRSCVKRRRSAPVQELLSPPAARAKTLRRGSRVFDPATMGYTDEGAYVLDTVATGNSNAGHDYGTDLSDDQKRELIEYLKTL